MTATDELIDAVCAAKSILESAARVVEKHLSPTTAQPIHGILDRIRAVQELPSEPAPTEHVEIDAARVLDELREVRRERDLLHIALTAAARDGDRYRLRCEELERERRRPRLEHVDIGGAA